MLKNKVLFILYFSLSIFLLLLIFSPIAFAQDESVTFTTYYPSPYGDYNNLTTNNFIARENVTLATEPGSRVGIGTTAPPDAPLDITGLGTHSGSYEFGQLVLRSSYDMNKKLAFNVDATNNIATIQSVHGGVAHRSLVLNPDGGNVGIGIANPGVKLDIVSSSNIGARVTTDGVGRLDLYTTAGGDTRNWALKTSIVAEGDFSLMNSASAGTNPSTHVLYANRSGNVGIGTTSPQRKLDVNGNAKFFGQVGIGAGSSPNAGLQVVYDGPNSMVNIHNSASQGVYIMPGWTAWQAQSDLRLKNILGEIDNSLLKIDKIRPVYYKLKTDDQDRIRRVGVIAQDVQKVFPEVVTTDEDGYLGIAYTELIPLLIGGIQEQQRQIAEIKEENNELKELVCLDHPAAKICK